MTISELAGTKQTTQVGGANASAARSVNTSNARASSVSSGDAGLYKDIGKMFGNVAKSSLAATDYANKQIKMDNSGEYNTKMSILDEEYRDKHTQADMAQKSADEKALFDYYMAKSALGSDNPYGEEDYKNLFARPAATRLAVEAKKNLNRRENYRARDTIIDARDKINVSGANFTQEQILELKTNVGTTNNPKTEKVDALWATSLTTAAIEQYNASTDLSASDISPAKFNELFGHMGTMTKDGVATKGNASTDDKAWKSVLSTWKSITGSVNAAKNENTSNYNLAAQKIKARIKDLDSSALSSAELSIEKDKIVLEVNTLVKNTNVKESDVGYFIIEGKRLDNEIYMANIVDTDIADSNSITDYISSGKKITMTDNITGKKITTTIPKSMYVAAITREMTRVFDGLETKDITKENVNSFHAGFAEMQRLHETSGIENPVEVKYRNFFQTKTGSVASLQDTAKSVEYVNWQLSNNSNSGLEYLKESNNQIAAILGGKDDDKTKKMKIASVLSITIKDRFAKENDRDNKKDVDAAIMEFQKGKGILTITDIPIDRSANTAMMKSIAASNGSYINAASYIDDKFDTLDIGSDFFGWDNQRIFVEKGTSRAFTKAKNSLLRNYNTTNFTDYSDEDLHFITVYNDKKNVMDYKVVLRSDSSTQLFYVNSSKIDITKAK